MVVTFRNLVAYNKTEYFSVRLLTAPMSWLRGAFDKVKEKSVVVKGIARDVASKTKEVRSRILGTGSSTELAVRECILR
jgi:hypothetical protein